MRMPTEQAIAAFKDAYQKWATLKRENRIVKGDVAPTGKDYGLLPSVEEFIKRQIDRETERK